MPDLKIREEKIQEKREQTPWREFLMEITSRYNFNLFRYKKFISRYPEVERNKNIVDDLSISMNNECTGEYTGDFFKDFNDLYERSPKANILHYGTNENCGFSDGSYGAKDCYLTFGAGRGVEKSLYSTFIVNSTNVLNSFCVTSNCDNIFSCKSILESSNVYYSVQIHNSYNIYFSSNLIGCKHCIFCDGLENQSYCIRNKQLDKEEYEIQKESILKDKTKFDQYYAEIHMKIGNIGSQNIVGKGVAHSENIENGYYVTYARNSKNVILYEGGKTGSYNFYDGIDIGIDSHDFYATVQAGTNAHDVYCCVFTGASNVYYSMNLDEGCSYCLGCYGLKNKSFCIFNKQYTKEERFELANKIFEQMDKDGTLGQFFPGSMNPFYFNDTAAYLIDDTFTKEEVTAQGYLRRDEEIKVDVPAGAEVIETKDLARYQGFNASGEREIKKDILKKVIKDEQGNYYRIMPMELAFLQKHGLPLPEIHWLERIKLGFKFK